MIWKILIRIYYLLNLKIGGVETIWDNVKQIQFWMYYSDFKDELEDIKTIKRNIKKNGKIKLYNTLKYIN